jgi:MipA family protein
VKKTLFFLLLLSASALQAQNAPLEPSAAPVPASTPVAISSTTAATAERDEALWEVGVVGGELYLPDYPAAGEKHAKWIAAPYVVYRGKILRADREGARARIVRGRWADVEMSFSGSFATHSQDNVARQGMPDLDYMIEMGPRASLLLYEWGDPLNFQSSAGTLRLYVPVRAVFSSDLSNFKPRGFTYSPALYTQAEPFLRPGWIGLLVLTGRFGNRTYASYFYDVAPEFARPDRQAYDARAGYVGSDVFAGVVIPIGKRWRIFTGGQFYYDEGSANISSPLFQRRSDFSVGLGISYAFFRSKAPAKD